MINRHVVCVQADELTDEALQVGQVYDLLEIVLYGSIEFYRVGVRGVWGVLNLSDDFEGLEVEVEVEVEAPLQLVS